MEKGDSILAEYIPFKHHLFNALRSDSIESDIGAGQRRKHKFEEIGQTVLERWPAGCCISWTWRIAALQNIGNVPAERARSGISILRTNSVSGETPRERDSRVRYELLVPDPVVAVLARTLGFVPRVPVQEHRRVEDGVVVRDDGALTRRSAPDDGLDPVRDVV